MANLNEISATTITGRLNYEEDFTFRKHKEELALSVRESVAPLVTEILAGTPSNVSIDPEGDVVLNAGNVFWVYVTKFGCTCSAAQIPFDSLLTSNLMLSMPRIVEKIHNLRSSHFKPASYGSRIFARILSPTTPSVEKLQSSCLSTALANLGKPTAFSCSYAYDVEPFTDKVEIEFEEDFASSVRISRDSDGTRFENFTQFWTQLDLQNMIDRIALFLEQLESRSKI